MRRTSEALRFDAFNKDKGRPPRQRTDDGMAASAYGPGRDSERVGRSLRVIARRTAADLVKAPPVEWPKNSQHQRPGKADRARSVAEHEHLYCSPRSLVCLRALVGRLAIIQLSADSAAPFPMRDRMLGLPGSSACARPRALGAGNPTESHVESGFPSLPLRISRAVALSRTVPRRTRRAWRTTGEDRCAKGQSTLECARTGSS
eukprot:scaffold819_cov239-Pinguiococcus_pyrenoidosus.AAC.17